MASSSLTSTLKHPSPPLNSPACSEFLSKFSSSPLFSFSRTPGSFRSRPKTGLLRKPAAAATASATTVRAQTLDFSRTFFEGGFGSEDDPTSPSGTGMTAVEEREEPQCPPGLCQYETMAVLRPDMSEDDRLALIQKYEERNVQAYHYAAWSMTTLLIAGGGMYVEVFNRGVIPLAYSIKKKNKAGECNTYLDGIYLLFTYFTKPESIKALEFSLKADDDIIRSSSFKVRKRKY